MLNWNTLTKVKQQYSEAVLAIYLVGSLPRGEFEEGYSDINLYIILNDETGVRPEAVRESSMVSIRVFSKEHFFSETSTRFRIIAKADGVLLDGADLLKDEKLPKAGLFLAVTLYGDILEIIDGVKQWMDENPTASSSEISRRSRRLAKRFIDFLYSVAISNKPSFTASRMERMEIINQEFPNEGVLDLLMEVSKYGVGGMENLTNMLNGFRSKAEINLKKMKEVEAALSKNS